VKVRARDEVGDEWETVAEFPRADFPELPSSVRYGKIGQSWTSADFPDKGSTRPCRVEWVRFH